MLAGIKVLLFECIFLYRFMLSLRFANVRLSEAGINAIVPSYNQDSLHPSTISPAEVVPLTQKFILKINKHRSPVNIKDTM